MFNRQLWLSAAIFALWNVAFASQVHADENIRTSVMADYTVSATDSTKVKIDYTLTNASPTVYVNQYQIAVSSSGLSGLVFQPGKQKVNKQEHDDHDRHLLDLEFENEVVGQGKSRQFGIEYSDRTLLKRSGLTQVLTLPPPYNYQTFDELKTIVRLPSYLGQPDMLQPAPSKTGSSSAQLVYTFDQSGGETIKIGYGQQQILQFSLDYDLVNQDNAPGYQEVVFPGDQEEVTFIFASISANPDYWAKHDDGSWHGFYLLQAGSRTQIQAQGYLIYRHIDRDFHIGEFYPALENHFTASNLDQLPPAFAQPDLTTLSFSSDIAWQGALARLDRYRLQLHNHTGWTISNLKPQVKVNQGQVSATLLDEQLVLLPWQQTELILRVQPQKWWQPYARFSATIELIDEQGQTIFTNDFQGVAISYAAFATLGAIVGLAAVAGSLLVAGRPKKRHLRR